MLLVYAQHLAKKYRKEGQPPPKVRAITSCSLNGQIHGPLIDPTVDLGQEQDTLFPVSWILPRPPRVPAPVEQIERERSDQAPE
jgi:Vitamin K-dependent gamma-carboxylase